eukprot:jgi/Botrbrau1/6852/Bobra.152_2s0012.1
MALSLICRQCNTQLRSVKEAQEHGEVTGHNQFEESVEAVLNLVCQDCGKPCKSQTEQDLHTKRTGHATFVDKTSESQVLDTEAQMKEAEVALKEESGIADLKADAEPVELVAPEVPDNLLEELKEMGFPTNRAVRALHFSGTNSVEQAVSWLEEHENEADLDEPLLVPKENVKPKLSQEDARKQAEELVRKAREKREKEEKELEKLREQERVRAGKELLAAKRQEDDLKLKRNLELRRIEKEEEARARERIRQKLEEDRRERRRKLGLPEELTEEEKEAERQRQAEKEKEKAAKKLTVKPVSTLSKQRDILVQMKKKYDNDSERVKTCWQTLLKYIANVAMHPDEEKYRKIKLGNAAFQSRVASLEGSLDFLSLVGFKADPSGEYIEMARDQINLELLNETGGLLDGAVKNPFFGAF